MRVWALASCSGLLALAACSAEQSSPPDLGTAPPDGDDAVEVNARPGLRATSSSPMARPELRSRQGDGDRARFSPRSAQASSLASQSSAAGQTLPQAAQLRERLQRLRAQHGSRLSTNTPIATAPLPAALTATPPRPVPQAEQQALSSPAAGVTDGNQSPGAIAAAGPGLAAPRPAGVAVLPTPPRPNVAAPELGLSSATSTAIDQGPVASLNQTDSSSAALGRHQGYSTRSAPTITTLSSQTSGELTARLHGATLVSPAGDPAAVAVAQPSSPGTAEPATAAPAPAQAETAPAPAPLVDAPLDAPLDAVVDVGSAPADAEPGPAATHQSSATPVTLTPLRLEASTSATIAHRSQGRAARPATAMTPGERSATTAPPESLPLSSGTPRLSPLRPAAVTSPDTASTVPAAVPEVLEVQPPALQTPETEASEAQVPESQTLGSTFPAHQGQSQPESLSLSPQLETRSKDLPTAYCLQAIGLPLSPEAEAASNLQVVDRQLDQLSMAIRSGSADATLALTERLSKTEPAAVCLQQNRAAVDAQGENLALPSN